MSYLALGGKGQTWCGVCRAPWLTTILESENHGTYDGGGIFWERNTYLANQRYPLPIELKPEWPQNISVGLIRQRFNSEDLSIIFHRLHRDGWRLNVDGQFVTVLDDQSGIVPGMPSPCDHPLQWKFSKLHPTLQVRYMGYRSTSVGDSAANAPIYAGRHGYLFHFELLDHPDLLGPQVDWATWTSQGDLIWAKYGVVYRQSLEGLANGNEPKAFDLNDLEPPSRPKPTTPFVV